MLSTLVRTETLSDTVTSFYFQPERPLHFLAGQWTELHLPHVPSDERGITRQFTVSSSPTEPELAITVDFSAHRSSFKQALRDLPLGASVQLDEPMGDFVLPLNPGTPLVWIAGGIGITPFRSMAKYIADTGENHQITLSYSLRESSEALFTDIFDAAGITDRHIITTKNDGRMTGQLILDALPSLDNPRFYIAGPEAMVEAMSSELKAGGVAAFDIITDAFLGYR